ncbi:sigma-54 interaction domain-containing protein [Clostridium chauvoei]|uniref:Sigma 54-interacting transcriptional regulator n=4 Tax=Clostridium chauvoei TaxID=46867 RepID=A0ABD4RK64_9CLOT|nr:sigma 54-interacting transcriptional regulator [Clostridium chauvoei]MBX7281614.1 sigma 54-interacting transcriptional regulator [Clostridium chauvoei]MBX7284134.1 sigma 54-interacting transcriptional regulator [Clostridium chauvoei]MBX7286662.1 sigma 54-interacting transcriptional regulator [Clostridium chauvoei]MBX7289173.1 sigma 54-interacting transcriptional regulator [Clostridium chauvoei]MBX7291688.1 sigma 54-interacting transcriptional regulator [Clostridium chauvoei]
MESLDKDYYKHIIDSLENGILTITKNFKIKFINNKAEELLKIRMLDINRVDILDIFPSLRLSLDEMIKNNENTIENINISKINNSFNCDLIKMVLPNGDYEFIMVLKERKKLISTLNKLTTSYAVYTFDNIIGQSPQINKVINDAKKISKSPSTVLITGESGCGKELLAQSIHNYSLRACEPFIAVNCGAIPKSLIESELFGYEEGSFTGAKKGGKTGKFELANGGTIFLDEIGEMPLEMQVHLLRVIQEGKITRVGGKVPIEIDVRIIAATNKDLKEEIKKGCFRNDLFYRLNVIPLQMPPLKDRFGDIPILIDYFLNIKSEKLNKPIPIISNKLLKKMISYCWPGNIRELENCVENIVNLNGETSYEMNFDECTCLKYDNLGNEIIHTCDDENCITCNQSKSKEEDCQQEVLLSTLLEIEQRTIKNTVDYFKGNMTKAAESLGISRNALYNKMKRYGIAK